MDDMNLLAGQIIATLSNLWNVIVADFWLTAMMSIWVLRRITRLFDRL